MMAGAIQLAKRAALATLDYALPPRCPGCGEIVGQIDAFCGACWGEMRFLHGPGCASCGLPFDFEEADGAQCGACLVDPPPWTSARAALSYGPVSSHVAMRLKYGRRTGLARLMARHMAARVPKEVLEAGKEALVIPVPLHRWRIWGRGFNQSALIAGQVARLTGLPHDPHLLERTRATRPLRDLGPRQREREVRQAFAIAAARREELRGKTVLLIDDIHTSGATARGCTRVLMASGARAVHVLCWARVL
ncbi:ComF family protein [Sphingobium sp. DEHP117]|nr:double zinc ribbon domain-containing protein [Sphingobium sp. DEHP117]MDQ4419128.1 ComF family protein [Sphingobium sp. DEHP117]